MMASRECRNIKDGNCAPIVFDSGCMNGWLGGLLMRNIYRSAQNIALFSVQFSSASLHRTPNAYFQALRMYLYICQFDF